ncbi:MAG: hypothetical protein MZU97_23575 [Bacillus subtilis]|nr:hypothetical protein [Bacillus subtilis]
MLFYFLFTVIFSIVASIAAASLLWRSYSKPLFGFIPVVMMAVLGIVMMSMFHALLMMMDTEAAVVLVYSLANAFVAGELTVCIYLDRKQRKSTAK